MIITLQDSTHNMVEPESTIGIWIGDNDAEMVDDFDDVISDAELHDGRYSRSEAIKDAMQTYQAVIEAMEANEFDVSSMSSFEIRSVVRQAIIDMD